MSGSKPLTPRLAATLLTSLTLLHQPLPAQQASTTDSIHGNVLNAITHQPIAHVLVSLDQYSQATLTDNEGRFTFDGVPVGQTMLSARRPGFSSDGGSNSNTDRQMVTIPGTGDITLELTPQSSITGELILPGDDSADSLQLQLLHQEIQNGRASWAIYRNAEATSDGHFRFGNLPSGAYLVHVGASPDPLPAQRPAGTVKLRSGYVPSFYPAAREIAAAGIITLSPGQQADIKMELTREPYYPVSIPVANAGDTRGIGFEVSSDSFLGLSARFSPQDGMVHIDLPAGHYLLWARSFNQRSVAGEKEFDVNPGSTAGRAAITLLPLNRIPVAVHVEFTHTTPAQSPAGSASAADQLRLSLERLGNGPGTHGPTPRLQNDPMAPASGASRLLAVEPGKYWVNGPAFNGYIAAMTSGGVDLLTEPLTVAADGSASPIDITLRDDTGSLSASLASNLQPSGQASHPSIYLTLLPRSGIAVERTETFAPDGTLTLGNVAPGSYLALASMARLQIEYRNPAAMTAFAGKGKTVEIEPGGSANITIDSLYTAGAAR